MPYIQNRTYRNSFLPSMTLFWNNLKENIKNLEKLPLKTHLTKHDPICNPYYYLESRQFNIIMARLRMRCSELRQHLFDMNIIDNNNCECGLPKTTSHFFLECPLYIAPRRILCDFFLCDVLLYGISNNFILNQATQDYVIATNRFGLLNNLLCYEFYNNCHNYS